jgi:tRNA (guanine37-N1)-methyltransferase
MKGVAVPFRGRSIPGALPVVPSRGHESFVMRIDILTLFPEMFTGFLDGSLLGAARASGLLDIRVTNIRDFAEGIHRQVDDRPFGGGPGMLLMPGPVVACAEHVVADGLQAAVGADVGVQAGRAASPVILLTPGGRRLTQEVVEELSRRERIILVCGRYEGFDARVRTALGAEELSIGDFVLSGGEVAAMVVVDAVCRLVPGVLGDEESARQDSFSNPGRLVEGPQYTRPREFRGMGVPDVLLSGDHGKIAKWRQEQAIVATRRRDAGPSDRPGEPSMNQSPVPTKKAPELTARAIETTPRSVP